jgi:hypothetical protein
MEGPILAEREHKNLEDVFNPTNFKLILDEIMKSRKVSPQDVVSYSPIERAQDGVTYVIKAEHVPIETVVKYASSSCKECYGKGHYVAYIVKAKVPNPQDYVILSEEPVVGMTEERKKLWLEVEKKKPTWKIMFPCRCAIKGISKKESLICSNTAGNIVTKVTYEIKQ